MKNKLLNWLEDHQLAIVWLACLVGCLLFWIGIVYTVYLLFT